MSSRPKAAFIVKRTGEQCFLVNAFSREVVHLPRLQSPSNYSYRCSSNYSYRCLDVSNSARPVGRFCRSDVSVSPSSVSKYNVAALLDGGGRLEHGLALWQPGMTSWYLCQSARISTMDDDLAFYQGKLYMVWRSTPDIFAFELREDEHGVSLSCPEHYNVNPIIPSKTAGSRRCNLVAWRGKLLLIIRFFREYTHLTLECNCIRNVEVFALDLSTSPCGVTQIHNFYGDCIFVQKSGCRSFSAGLHDGVRVPGDLIYFLEDGSIGNNASYTYVYNMRDGTLWRIVAGVKEECFLDFPVWIFPTS